MREGIGSVVMYNIIIVFIVLTFGFLSATLAYSKAFKVNGRIANSLEKFEGYNNLSAEEINSTLTSIGYRMEANSDFSNCPKKKHNGHTYEPIARAINKNHKYCLYEYTQGDDYHNGYFTYGIVTYIFMDIPVIGGTFSIPVSSETESIFKFSPDSFKG